MPEFELVVPTTVMTGRYLPLICTRSTANLGAPKYIAMFVYEC